ncbi:TPA: NAD-dependent epimerase/dehydratase family protein [Candidatus Woesearchaeota archaeon]|nr:NAD-dependent epimerase/dehydratase family protein [Candidatus Woesearchaeota archaeon]
MKVLVTGGAGFIGSHVCDALLDRGDTVICVDNFNDYYDVSFKESNISHHKDDKDFILYREDITDLASMHAIFEKELPDKIIHLAARAGVRPSISQPFLYEKVNITGTLNLLELSKEFSVKNFVYASSSSVYGGNKKVPFSESDPVDNPVSPYAATKKSCELLCHAYHHLHNLNITCLRFFTVYGPRGRPDMAPYLFTEWVHEGKPIKRFGPGTSKRDYTFVSDIVSGMIGVLDKDFSFEILNLGNSQTVELNYFISVIEGLLGKKAVIEQHPEQPGDVPITYADISKAKKLISFSPSTTIEEGMKMFIDWYIKERAGKDEGSD